MDTKRILPTAHFTDGKMEAQTDQDSILISGTGSVSLIDIFQDECMSK